ncbi:MAG TPA: hypothetical protein VHB20_08050 [Verrucomicrobiae bacterium]|jgi:hypothetical protein|nr:hypothetical protein [Verrucomicrobiae bacterium]
MMTNLGGWQPSETLATFGQAVLLKDRGGAYTLCGGTFDDQCEAREWISLFLHEAVVRETEPFQTSRRN